MIIIRYQDFLQWHPEFKTQFSRALDHARFVAITKPVVESWLNLWQSTIAKYSITQEHIYNMNKTGIMMGVLGRSLVVIPRHRALRYMRQPGNKNWVSIPKTINGNNQALDPMIIFKDAHHQASWYPQQTPSSWRYAICDNGWTNNELGFIWL